MKTREMDLKMKMKPLAEELFAFAETMSDERNRLLYICLELW